MLSDPIDQYKVDVLLGRGDLHLHMGEVCIVSLAIITEACLYLPFTLVPQLRCGDPSPMEKELPLCCKADDIVLP